VVVAGLRLARERLQAVASGLLEMEAMIERMAPDVQAAIAQMRGQAQVTMACEDKKAEASVVLLVSSALGAERQGTSVAALT
jgi:hypothetical protein